ncbi:hypothetical protein Bbelb_164520 [Branchiostoma belcheri]|nr:hypothetical protein Bbelb_164520 [Branchiostoma belcheri]
MRLLRQEKEVGAADPAMAMGGSVRLQLYRNLAQGGRTHTCFFRTARTGHARRSYSHLRVVNPLTALMPTFPEKPCGEFPWPADDREYTVNCDYSYTSYPDFVEVEPQGRCKVRCPTNSTEFLVGPPFDGNQGLTDGLYYCNRLNGTWLGSQPVCLGFYNNATMVTDESKGIRLVGGSVLRLCGTFRQRHATVGACERAARGRI